MIRQVFASWNQRTPLHPGSRQSKGNEEGRENACKILTGSEYQFLQKNMSQEGS